METDNRESILAFNAMCDELVSSKLIMSNQKIRMLLRCLAYYDELRDAVDECKRNFDYEREYSRAIVNLGTATMFRMPLSPRKKVALTVCLLLDFDEPRRDFVKFMLDFFPAADRQQSYAAFCENVIEPFREAMLSVLQGKAVEVDEPAPLVRDAQKIEVNAAISEQAEHYINSAVKFIKESNLEENFRNDLVFMLDNFKVVLDMRDAQLIKAYWIGLKYILKSNRVSVKIISAIEEILEAYLVL